MLQAFSIRTLIDKCNNEDLLIPSIQRGFVWKSSQVLALLDSLRKDIPIQSFILWKTRENLICKTINDQTPETVNTEKSYVLDGQQRIKSIYKLFSSGGCRGFITEEAEIKFGDTITEKSIPLCMLLEDSVRSVLDIFNNVKIKRTEKLDRLLNELFLLIDKEILYFYELRKVKAMDMFEIFKRINISGTKLSTSELVKCVFNYYWSDSIHEMTKISHLYKKENIHLSIENIVSGIRIHYTHRENKNTKYSEIIAQELADFARSEWKYLKSAYLKVLDFRKDLPLINGSLVNMCMFYFLYEKTDITYLTKYCYYYITNKLYNRSTDTQMFHWINQLVSGAVESFNIYYESIPKSLLLKLLYNITMKDTMFDSTLSEDHIFSKSELKYLGIDNYDDVGNLLMLPVSVNSKKGNMSAISFYEKSIYNKQILITIPHTLSSQIYQNFIKERNQKVRELVIDYFKNTLGVVEEVK
jgi:hypothetical protein